jgi:glycine cleavage system aminomethyltransferase T
VPNANDPVLLNSQPAGRITNAAISERLECILARAWLPAHVQSDTEVEVLTGATRSAARVCRDYRWYDPRGLQLRV